MRTRHAMPQTAMPAPSGMYKSNTIRLPFENPHALRPRVGQQLYKCFIRRSHLLPIATLNHQYRFSIVTLYLAIKPLIFVNNSGMRKGFDITSSCKKKVSMLFKNQGAQLKLKIP